MKTNSVQYNVDLDAPNLSQNVAFKLPSSHPQKLVVIATTLAHLAECPIRLLEQVPWRIKLNYTSSTENKNAVVICYAR